MKRNIPGFLEAAALSMLSAWGAVGCLLSAFALPVTYPNRVMLVWLCWALFCRDMEMSCDEAVLRRLGGSIRMSYSESLLRFAAPGGFPALAFGEHGGVARIKNVLKWKP